MRAAALLVLALFACGAEAAGQAAQCSVRPDEALQRINAARAAGQRCGWHRMAPAPPLRWEGRLHAIAAAHSRDMAHRNYFGHRSPEGREIAHRATAGHYKFRLVGENLAGGNPDVKGAVRAWIGSPAHCRNLMNPKFAEVAVACVGRRGSQWGTYWTMVLGQR